MDKASHLKSLINKAKLSAEDKERWQNMTAGVPDFYLSNLIYMIEQVPDGLMWLNQNLKDKIEVLKKKDKAAWSAFVKKEKEDLQKLLG